MIVIPAVDVKEGRCVRLREGRADAETVFSEDPVAMAKHWRKELRRAWPRRGESPAKRRWVRWCIQQYKTWCNRI